MTSGQRMFPFSHQSCHSAPKRLLTRAPALTARETRPRNVSSNSPPTPLLPVMFSSQNGLPIDNSPWLSSFL